MGSTAEKVLHGQITCKQQLCRDLSFTRCVMEMNLFNFSMRSEERKVWTYRFHICCPASAQEVRDRVNPWTGTQPKATERCLAVRTFVSARQTQAQACIDQNGKEMPAFPLGSRQQSYKSQGLQRGSSVRRYLRNWGGSTQYKPAVPRCQSYSWRCGARLEGPEHIFERAGCYTFASTTIVFWP